MVLLFEIVGLCIVVTHNLGLPRTLASLPVPGVIRRALFVEVAASAWNASVDKVAWGGDPDGCARPASAPHASVCTQRRVVSPTASLSPPDL